MILGFWFNVNFYRYVFKNFPKDIDKAISACINKNYKKSLIPVRSSYYGLPSRKDVRILEIMEDILLNG